MAQCRSFFVSTAILFAFSASAGAQSEPHVHGAGRLQVAIDESRLTLAFESPLDNLVGFEHAPRTEKHKDAVRRMAERLRKPETLFAPSPPAACSPIATKLESPVLDPSYLGGIGAKAEGKGGRASAQKDGGGHASLSAEFVYRCDRADALRDIEVKLFDFFPQLKRLDVQVAAAKGQKSAKLSPGNRRVAW